MMRFKLFLENTRQIINLALQARQQAGCDKARFGDCRDVSERTVVLLKSMGIPAKLKGGHFIANPDENDYWDHSWVVIDGEILDPTVDQFFSTLDVDLETETPGIYYSALDGPWLMNRYKTWN